MALTQGETGALLGSAEEASLAWRLLCWLGTQWRLGTRKTAGPWLGRQRPGAPAPRAAEGQETGRGGGWGDRKGRGCLGTIVPQMG